VEFAETAVWAVEAALAGATVIGVSGLIKDKAAVSSKLQATKVDIPTTAKTKFAQKRQLREKSSQRISAIAKEKVAAGTSQKVSSFKLVREIPTDSTHSGVFHKEVEFTYKKTGQKFTVTQRSDIDPNYVVTLKDGKQVTNRQLMLEGKAPYTTAGECVIIHHIGQNAKGPLVEVTENTHNPLLHKQYGTNEAHPTNPVVRGEFDPIREEYWKTYGETFK
jgi:hypothetical protein